MKLKIQKNLKSQSCQLLHGVGTYGSKKLAADFQSLRTPHKGPGKGQGGLQPMRVNGYD